MIDGDDFKEFLQEKSFKRKRREANFVNREDKQNKRKVATENEKHKSYANIAAERFKNFD